MENSESDNADIHLPSTSKDPPDDLPIAPVPMFINLNEHKAGLSGVDHVRINKIIQDASKGSHFYTHQQNRQKRIDKQVEKHRKTIANLSEDQRKLAEQKANLVLKELETKRRVSRILVHFDIDMFFAAVELKKQPQIATKPVAVGTMAMISTSNYVARKAGVRSAMAGFIAKKLCPELILIPPSFHKYADESKDVMNIISEYDPNMNCFSLDEVHIDLTDYVFQKYSFQNSIDISELYNLEPGMRLPDELWELAFKEVDQIRARIFNETQLTISAGIACNSLLSKVCTDINKPDGQFMLKGDREEIMSFVADLEVRKFPGIGPVAGQILSAFNITTGKKLYEERATIFNIFTENIAYQYMKYSLGIGRAFLDSNDVPQKSHSREKTFGELSKFEDLFPLLMKMSKKLSCDLKSNNQICRTITLKLKKTTFEVFLKAKSISNFTDNEQVILKVAKELLSQEITKSPTASYRLIGVKVSNLIESVATDSTSQPTLSEVIDKFQRKTTKDHFNQVTPQQATLENNHCHYTCRLCEETFNEACDYDFHRLECEGDLNPLFDENEQTDIESLKGEDNSPAIRRETNILSYRTPIPTDSSSSGIDQSDTSSSVDRLTCPICSMTNLYTNVQLNRHIDSCLNKSILIELTKVPASLTSATPTSSTAQPSNLKRPVSSEKGSKKRKKVEITELPSNAQMKIDHFFAKK